MRGRGVEKGDGEEPARGGGVGERSGRRLSHAKKGQREGGRGSFFLGKGVGSHSSGFSKKKKRLKRREFAESGAERTRRLR